jgi:ribosomal protein S20
MRILVIVVLVGISFGQAKKSVAKKLEGKPTPNQTLSKDFRTAGRRALDAITRFSAIPSLASMNQAFDAIKEAKVHTDNEADNRAARVLENLMDATEAKTAGKKAGTAESKDAWMACEVEAETIFEHGTMYDADASILPMLSKGLPKCGQATN